MHNGTSNYRLLSLLLHIFLSFITNNRISFFNCMINNFCLIRRQIDTSVTSFCLVYISSELRLPVCVMQSLSTHNRHPVLNDCFFCITKGICNGYLLIILDGILFALFCTIFYRLILMISGCLLQRQLRLDL